MDNSAENITLSDVLPVSRTSHVRNQILGGTGLLCNVAAISLLWVSSSIRPSLKMSLISLSLSDLLVMLVAAVWRPSLPCWPAMYIISSTILVSYFSILVLALHNYLAVFYPTRCKEILSSARTLVILIACWLVGHLISLACLGVHIPKGSSCYVIAIMPRSGVMVESCICLVCCCIIVATNLRVLVHIRRRQEPGTRSVPPAKQERHLPGATSSADIFSRNKNSDQNFSSSSNSSMIRFSRQDSTKTATTEVLPLSVMNTSPITPVEIAESVNTVDKTRRISTAQYTRDKRTFVTQIGQANCLPIEIEGNFTSISPTETQLEKNQLVFVKNHPSARMYGSPIAQSLKSSKHTRSAQFGVCDGLNTIKMGYIELPVIARLPTCTKNSLNVNNITNSTNRPTENKSVKKQEHIH